MLKCQHHVCFNDELKSCLTVSSDDRQSITGHHPKHNSYTDLLLDLMLLCCVVNCSPVHHLSHIFYFKPFRNSKNVLRNQSCRELTLRVYISLFFITIRKIVNLALTWYIVHMFTMLYIF